jgi:DNA polymerase I-like protein with 3'-5' exonuclease and polymerase domains
VKQGGALHGAGLVQQVVLLEFGIAAALSGDRNMMAAYESTDPYLEFAKQAGAVPPSATKQSHKAARDQFKTCALGIQYCMGAGLLADRLAISLPRAQELLRLHKQTYPDYWRFSDAAASYGMLHGCLHATFGWRIHVTAETWPTTLRNFPLQANGSEMMRLACVLAAERRLPVCCPVHDALLVEAPVGEIDGVVAETQRAMRDASLLVLPGFPLRTEAKVFRWPERFVDDRGLKMWEKVWGLIGKGAGGREDVAPAQQGMLRLRNRGVRV